jgi:hypothetical protein
MKINRTKIKQATHTQKPNTKPTKLKQYGRKISIKY